MIFSPFLMSISLIANLEVVECKFQGARLWWVGGYSKEGVYPHVFDMGVEMPKTIGGAKYSQERI